MITRVQRLKACGIFQDFTWPSSGLDDCKRYNLIFGWNGTGKSTLSEILRRLEERQRPDGEQVQLLWGSEKLDGSDFPSSELPIKVFNGEFVEETVEGELKPIAVFGKENIEKKRELDELVKEAAKLRQDLPELRRAKKVSENELEKFCTASGKSIKHTLGREGNSYANYNKARFKCKAEELLELAPDERKKLAEDEQGELLQRTRAPAKEALARPSVTLPDVAQLRDDVAALRKRSVVSEAIEELSANHEISRWVQQGMLLHEEQCSESCLYCGQSLPEERTTALKKHFSDAVTKLQGDIETSIRAIDATHDELAGVAYPKKAEIADHLAAKYPETQRAAKEGMVRLCKELMRLRKGIEEKRSKQFESLATEHSAPIPTASKWEEFLDFLDEHNKASRNHAEGTAAAQESYERAQILDCLESYQEKQKEAQDAAEKCEEANKRLRDCDQQIEDLRAELVSHKIPAKQLTADLARYLGHNDLAFEARDEGYRVTRRGQTAKKLSDGEKTAIAILYFLKTFDDESFRLEDSVVVFDDPVSSLDSNALYKAFSFIKDRSKAAKQLFILTHNFPFFRLVRQWFKNLRRQDRHQRRILMLKASCTSTGRQSAIVDIDPLLIDFDSEYQYLFGRVHSLATNHNAQPLEHYLPAPNMARRVLEAFLAFKAPFPSGSSFYARLESVDKNEERRSRIYRFCNMQSHLNAVGDYDEDLSCLSGAPALLQDVLKLIEDADPLHYAGMASCVAGQSA